MCGNCSCQTSQQPVQTYTFTNTTKLAGITGSILSPRDIALTSQGAIISALASLMLTPDEQRYAARLSIPIRPGDPNKKFFTQSGQHVATGYTRIVVGQRGPYVELKPESLNPLSHDESSQAHYYYIELRTSSDNVKVYVQVNRVDYADYIPGMCYISPFDLYDEDGKVLIESLRSP